MVFHLPFIILHKCLSECNLEQFTDLFPGGKKVLDFWSLFMYNHF